MRPKSIIPWLTFFALVISAAVPRLGAQTPRAKAPLPDDVEKREVTIWSDGTRMAGDLYVPKDLKADAKLPAVIFCNGTGGTKRGTPERLGPIFVQHGYIFLAFDYRGWGVSESPLMALEKMPKPDAKGELTVHVRAVRWQMDYADQTTDIRNAISFLSGEPGVDPERIGIFGSSYGGGLVTWVAGNDPRVKCVAAQVPGMGGVRSPGAAKSAYQLATKQARAETEPVPFETGKLGGKLAVYDMMRSNPAKNIGYNAIEAAEKIKAPIIIVVAENEELMDNAQNGGRVYDIVKAKGVPCQYNVLKGITHYGVYKESFEEATKLELAFFDEHLKGVKPTEGAK